MASKPDPTNLRAIVDIGSNGIRFSISDLSPPTTRIMPTLFQDRASISLYDAQYSDGKKIPIPEETVSDVIRALKSFKRTCLDFGVPQNQIQLVATEAMREAPNSLALRKEISQKLGWEIKMLPKEEESRIGAMGIASSFDMVRGFVMDLGGGSVHIAWMESIDGTVSVQGATSLPYGAAALTRRMKETGKSETHAALSKELEAAFKTAVQKIQEAAGFQISKEPTVSLFLSGGGFRGWGQLLMDGHEISPYPIPIINGFHVTLGAFQDVEKFSANLSRKIADGGDVFRISDRRATQVPAVALLVTSLTRALPSIQDIYFAQGGVREGTLFSQLPPDMRKLSPLKVATIKYAPGKDMFHIFNAALPKPTTPGLIRDLLYPFANMLYVHQNYAKGTNAPAALRSTTTGVLGSVHGCKHEQRAVLGLMLCAKWGGDLPPSDEDFAERLRRLVGPELSWWALLVGAVGVLVAAVYPAGITSGKTERMSMSSEFGPAGKHGDLTVGLDITFDSKALDGEDAAKLFDKQLETIEKVGKKKNRVGGKQGFGYRVTVSTRTATI